MTSAISLDAWKTEALVGILGIRDNLVKNIKRFSLSEEKIYGYMGYQDQINMIKRYLLILMVLKSP